MKIELGLRESVVVLGKRIVNDTGRRIALVILDEPGDKVQVDRKPLAKKNQRPAAHVPKATAT